MKKLIFILLIFFCYNTSDAIQRKGRQLGADSSTVLLLQFNESTGTITQDNSNYSNHGEVSGAVRIDGLWGKCLDFDGADDYVDCGKDASFAFPDDKITILAWIYPESYGAYRDIIRIAKIEIYLVVKDEALAIGAGDWGAPFWHSGDTIIPLNTWSFVGFTFDGSFIRLWYNGKLDNTPVASSATFRDTDRVTTIGSQEVGAIVRVFDGGIEGLVVKERALSAAEIMSDYQSQRGDYQ